MPNSGTSTISVTKDVEWSYTLYPDLSFDADPCPTIPQTQSHPYTEQAQITTTGQMTVLNDDNQLRNADLNSANVECRYRVDSIPEALVAIYGAARRIAKQNQKQSSLGDF